MHMFQMYTVMKEEKRSTFIEHQTGRVRLSIIELDLGRVYEVALNDSNFFLFDSLWEKESLMRVAKKTSRFFSD